MNKNILLCLLFIPVFGYSQWKEVESSPVMESTNFLRYVQVGDEFLWQETLNKYYSTKDFKTRKSIAPFIVGELRNFVLNNNFYFTNNQEISLYTGDGQFQKAVDLPQSAQQMFRVALQYDDFVLLNSGNLWGTFDGNNFDSLIDTEGIVLHVTDSLLFIDYDSKLIRYNHVNQTSDTLEFAVPKSLERAGFYPNLVQYDMIPYQDKIAFFEEVPGTQYPSYSRFIRSTITDGREIYFDTVFYPTESRVNLRLPLHTNYQGSNIVGDMTVHHRLFDHIHFSEIDFEESINYFGLFAVDTVHDAVVIRSKNNKGLFERGKNRVITKLNGKEIGFGYVKDQRYELFDLQNDTMEVLFESNPGFYGLFEEFGMEPQYYTQTSDALYFLGFNRQAGLCLYKTEGTKETSGLVDCLSIYDTYRMNVSLYHIDGKLYVVNRRIIHDNNTSKVVNTIYEYTGKGEIQEEPDDESEDFFEVGIDFFRSISTPVLLTKSAHHTYFNKNKNDLILLSTPDVRREYSGGNLGALLPKKSMAFGCSKIDNQNVYNVFDGWGNLLNSTVIETNSSVGVLNDDDEIIVFANSDKDIIINDSLVNLHNQRGYFFLRLDQNGNVIYNKHLSQFSGQFAKNHSIEYLPGNQYLLSYRVTHSKLISLLDNQGNIQWEEKGFACSHVCISENQSTALVFDSEADIPSYIVIDLQSDTKLKPAPLSELEGLTISAVHIYNNDRLLVATYRKDTQNSRAFPKETYLFEYTLSGRFLRQYDFPSTVIKSLESVKHEILASFETKDSIGVYKINRAGAIVGAHTSPNLRPNVENKVKIHSNKDHTAFYVLADLSGQFNWDFHNIRYSGDYLPGAYFSYMKRPMSIVQNVNFDAEAAFEFDREKHLFLFPNPVAGWQDLTILSRQGDFDFQDLTIYDMRGAEVGAMDLTNKAYPMQIRFGNMLKPSVYIFVFSDAQGEKDIHKVVVY